MRNVDVLICRCRRRVDEKRRIGLGGISEVGSLIRLVTYG